MEITKKIILGRVDKVIYNYDNKIKDHGVHTCPLCTLFRDESSKHRCNECPNFAFLHTQNLYARMHTQNLYARMHRDFGYACVGRHYQNKALDWDTEDNRLSEYWREIKALLVASRSEQVVKNTKALQKKIVAIAETYKTLEDNPSESE
jgi:hypothetical protein